MGCKALFIGGIKSGKSLQAEKYTLKLYPHKPIYLATNEVFDEEMQERVKQHKLQRQDSFITLEEPLHLYKTLQHQNKTVLIECISMWINNMLYHGFTQQDIFDEIEQLSTLPQDIVFVINDVSCSVVSENKLVREFVDINGKVAQLLAQKSQEVYNIVAGLEVQIK